MFSIAEVSIAVILSFLTTLFVVFPIKTIAEKLKIMDIPDQRKVHKKPIPRMGGLGIVIGTFVGILYLQPENMYLSEIITGATIIVIIGLLDDKFTLSPIIKLAGQILAAGILIYAEMIIERITLPFIGIVELNILLSTVITLIWIIGITNAINLIDGLDGLASGVSTIALISMLVMAVMDERIFVVYLCVALIGSNLGFLFHNFYPAKIYMGDTGSLFLGYSVAVISILGLFKKHTFFSFIIPIIVLALPIFDTLFAILRRAINGEKIMKPDKKHIHHQLLSAGYSHRTTVLIMYGVSTIFGILAISFSRASLGMLLFLAFVLCIMVYFLAEVVGLVGKGRKPVIESIRRILLETRKD